MDSRFPHRQLEKIYSKIKNYNTAVNFDTDLTSITVFNIFLKTLGFTYLNPHVYSDTVFFLGNFSKNFLVTNKYFFGIGASLASFLFFYSIGYLSKLLSKYLPDNELIGCATSLSMSFNKSIVRAVSLVISVLVISSNG